MFCFNILSLSKFSAIKPPTIYIHAPSPIGLDVRDCVKSLTLNSVWHEHMFISEDNPHLSSWNCRDELDSATILNLFML